MHTRASATHNLTRVLRRRLGLTQSELAFLVGYHSDSQVSRIENGTRVPHLAEVLVLELVFGVPATVVFPLIREIVGKGVKDRARLLLAELKRPAVEKERRISYKAAQLERVVASLGIRDEIDQGGHSV